LTHSRNADPQSSLGMSGQVAFGWEDIGPPPILAATKISNSSSDCGYFSHLVGLISFLCPVSGSRRQIGALTSILAGVPASSRLNFPLFMHDVRT